MSKYLWSVFSGLSVMVVAAYMNDLSAAECLIIYLLAQISCYIYLITPEK